MVLSAILVLSGLAACEQLQDQTPPPPQPSPKPSVQLFNPIDNMAFASNLSVPVDAVAQDLNGIQRIDLVVNGVIVETTPLFFVTQRYEYHGYWLPTGVGKFTLGVIAYSAKGVPSDLVAVVISVVPPQVPVTDVAVTTTGTPNVKYITATSLPTLTPTRTPIIIIVTAAPPPTHTPTMAPVPTRTPIILIVTATPKKP